ncbi:MAG: hypothetical protein AMJ95_02440 [Omnitrophica WOR_2 bacterium SM23_72]|nr:MAG: hypothetical protein AMJ95_02440 [Omnitrophica WOR_2 bacterium SM23_72]
MEKLISFRFYNRFDGKIVPFALKTKTRDPLILKIIDKWENKLVFSSFPQFRLDSGRLDREPNIVLSLKMLHRPAIRFKKDSVPVYINDFVHIYNFNRSGYCSTTHDGSYIKADIEKKEAAGVLVKGDPHIFALLRFWLSMRLAHSTIFKYRIYLHGACVIDKAGAPIIFIGKNGAGKSTICALLNKNRNFKIIHDDSIVIYPVIKKINLVIYNRLCRNIFSVATPKYLFFLNKDTCSDIKITPISKKEAFKKIVFATEFPNQEDKIRKQKKLYTLSRLVEQCACFSLVNGKGLRENPASFLKLFESSIKVDKINSAGPLSLRNNAGLIKGRLVQSPLSKE